MGLQSTYCITTQDTTCLSNLVVIFSDIINRFIKLCPTSTQVHGFIEDVSGKKVATLLGKWDDSMYYVNNDGSGKPKDCTTSSDASLLWKRSKPPPNPTRYNLTSFAITLNELTPGLQVDMMY